MNKKFQRMLALAFALVMVFGLAACTQSTGDEAEVAENEAEVVAASEVEDTESAEETESQAETTDASGDKVLVYLSGPEAMINKLEEAFEEENGDVLDMTIMSCGQLRNKVWTESQAGNIQADVFWGSDPLVYNKLNDAGKLEALNIKDIDAINPEFVLDGKNYALVSERYIGIMYNTTMLTEEPPKSYADLADEKYNGQMCMADATQSSTAFAIASSLYEITDGNCEYFQALKQNGILLQKSNGLVPSSIMEGQIAMGIAPNDAFVRLQNKGKKEGFEVPLEMVWPEEGAIAIQRPVAIPINENRSAEKEETAQKFVNFLISKKAQSIMNNFGFESVRNDIENTYLPEGIEVCHVDWDTATANEEALKSEYSEIFH